MPFVYALNCSFPSEHSVALMKRESKRFYNAEWSEEEVICLMREFVERLSYKFLLNSRDIDRLSIWQMLLFQKKVSPFVMDLPILNRKKGERTNYIHMSKEQFEKLLNSDDKVWRFERNDMNWNGETVTAGYFHMEDDLLYGGLSAFLHDLVVKCKFEFENEGRQAKVVFTPFAIFRSMKFESVFALFKLLYENTPYGERCLEYFPDREYLADIIKGDHNLGKAMFRANIYSLSSFIGQKFRMYVKKMINIDLEYDWEIMSDSFNSTFRFKKTFF